MKNAIGKNGTGAGSIFWNYYLKPNGWLKSNKRKYIKENVSKKFYSYWNITPIGISKTPDKRRHIAKKIHSLDSIFNKKVGKKHGRII
ncbi:hypothetical protein [Mesoplasma melaleucae]|uniref:Uncharacterized protein n=1 Tax=Mesoplasma melaleucae TaxID=81459 RepID=A0A2K8NVI9_9MOLU|nr:hypothetical protein [Mesoplasma melaleucae]ATZ17787.1 hypothetical protein EMELA_v1c02140 [Mesoplasma melaleucae]